MPLFNDIEDAGPEENQSKQTIQHTPIPAYNEPELIKWRLSYNDIINQFIFDIRGLELVETPDGKTQVIQVTKPKMNEEGTKAIKSFLTTKLTKIAASTNLNQQEINMMMRDAHEQLAYLFFLNQEKWQVKPEEAKIIMYEALDLVYLLLKKSYEDKERRYMAQTETITTITHPNKEPTRKWWIFKR